MTSSRPWALAGVVAGIGGLAASYLCAGLLTIRESPVVAVAELVVRLTPGPVAERAIDILGSRDKPFLLSAVVVVLLGLFALAGWLWSRAWWQSVLLWVALALVGLLAVLGQRGADVTDTIPIGVGLALWLVLMLGLAALLRRDQAQTASEEAPGRRAFLLAAGTVTLVGVALGSLGRMVGNRKRAVQESRRLLRIPGVTDPDPGSRNRIGVRGVQPWRTSNQDFYLIDTTMAVPAINPSEWRLRIHGMVDRELVLTYQDLLDRGLSEAWVTLNCVSNPVGGPLIGNAWWSGILTADLLEEVGVSPRADAVLQTSDDGWTCSTPLEAMTDGRGAMLAVAMNGEPLPIEHGFPVRTVVPGLYGYVSACKWVVDLEVTRFADVTAFWTERGWAERGPVKLSSRVDVPRSGESVPAGRLRVGGTAWHQQVGIAAVEVALDGGPWIGADLARQGSKDTWVQWAATLDVAPGDHLIRVRATGEDGQVQTGVRTDVVPDGATGWHEVDFTAEEA
ncbi:molybdopterin-dependent oxidoreductase [Nocardioides sp. 616]|uniref:molybdopterin-dependent oxidoreductase n=1 Tax=Nocardioides sp. 616 TaxID=2268090 RepID=UPI000CE43BC3|nr:molybdopterin-dependent oxidoreductase [Nocardioides sp. 616]